jgi:hypothetical protein
MSHHQHRQSSWLRFVLLTFVIASLATVAVAKTNAPKTFRVRVEVSPSDPKQPDDGLIRELRRSFEHEVGALPNTRVVDSDGKPDLVLRVTASPDGPDRVTLAAVVLTAVDNNRLMSLFTRRCGEKAQQELVSLLDQTSSVFVIYRTTWLRSGHRSEMGTLSRQLSRELDSEYLDQLRKSTELRGALQESLRKDPAR